MVCHGFGGWSASPSSRALSWPALACFVEAVKKIIPTFFGSCGLLLYCCLALGFTHLGNAADWPQFLGPDRNGVSRETNSFPAWPQDGPKQIWQKNTGQGFSGPVVSGDKLILFHRLGNKETVECLE